MLTLAEQTTLKNSINGDGALSAAVSAKDWPAIANVYNAATATNVWRANVTPTEIAGAVTMSAFTALSAVQQNGLLLLTQGPVDATVSNVRTAFSTIFGAGPTLTALTALAQRSGTRFEILFSAAAGAANVTTKFGQTLTAVDVQTAMAS